jgi:hypothetical protein
MGELLGPVRRNCEQMTDLARRADALDKSLDKSLDRPRGAAA